MSGYIVLWCDVCVLWVWWIKDVLSSVGIVWWIGFYFFLCSILLK